MHAQGQLQAAQHEYSLAVVSYNDPALAAYPILAASQVFVAQGALNSLGDEAQLT